MPNTPLTAAIDAAHTAYMDCRDRIDAYTVPDAAVAAAHAAYTAYVAAAEQSKTP